ncbi:hypothetical protein BDW02DRAFT_604162 [Decorospora gaudefroyi]|uniref:Uncharacterized protein n=1 Tax=Decorospora gaudefroyi TaxID=184978 RepID=A0A6A5KQW3_9PLEO|nr:hypothetical protein BDW02DRAFT_604162 [Decorospora gaudefroyi]
MMNTLQQMLCVKSAATVVKELGKLQFPAYGSLYFADAPIDPSLRLDFSNGFCIGPHCATNIGAWNLENLAITNSCPYQPTPQELIRHAKEWEDFETFQRLKLFLVRSINSNTDSWVPSEAWEAAKDANQSVSEEWMQTAAQSEDPDMNEDRGRKLWPFDVNIDG